MDFEEFVFLSECDREDEERERREDSDDED